MYTYMYTYVCTYVYNVCIYFGFDQGPIMLQLEFCCFTGCVLLSQEKWELNTVFVGV